MTPGSIGVVRVARAALATRSDDSQVFNGAMMNIEKDSYRLTWTHDIDDTSSGERSTFCEKSEVVRAPIRVASEGGREGLSSPR